MFTDVGKDVGATAAHELHQTVDEAIPAAEAAVAAIVERAGAMLVASFADLANRLDGVEIPFKFTFEGKIGPVRVPAQDYDATVKPSVEVKA